MNWHQTYQLPDIEIIELIERLRLKDQIIDNSNTTIIGISSNPITTIVPATNVSGVDEIIVHHIHIEQGKVYYISAKTIIRNSYPNLNIKLIKLRGLFKNTGGVVSQIGFTDVIDFEDGIFDNITVNFDIDQPNSSVILHITGINGLAISYGCKIRQEFI